MKRLVSVTTAISLVATGTVMITQMPAHAVTGPAWTTPVVVGEK